jgi:hypothetical protein
MSGLPKTLCVAVLYQAAPPPMIGDARKPMKPGGWTSRVLRLGVEVS